MSEMVKRVAAAIRDGVVAHDQSYASLEDIARAAIEAMREPTPDMERAMKGAFAPTGRQLYQMAIDAALSDGRT